MNTRDFDLNSLSILNAVIECGTVTAAAHKMALSPSSITYAINKIRRKTANPVFTRSKNGIIPTTLALELNHRYVKAINLINHGLNVDGETHTTALNKTLTISAYTFLELWFAHSVFKDDGGYGDIMLNFVNHPKYNNKRISQLRNHEVDIDIGGMLPNDASIISCHLFTSDFSVMVNAEHPSIIDDFTLEHWCENKHIEWVQLSDELLINVGDANIVKEMRDRKIAISSATSLTSLMACAYTDCLMLVPRYLEPFLLSTLPVKFFALPFETTMTSSIYAHFHRSAKNSDVVSASLNLLKKLSQVTNNPSEEGEGQVK